MRRAKSPRTALVADREPGYRELLRILLEHEGCEVSEAGDGIQAVTMARRILPDLIFLDLELPLLDGFAAVRAMRCDDRLKPRSIVALTASPEDSNPHQLQEAGFTAHFQKPVLLRVLSGQLSRLLAAPPGR